MASKPVEPASPSRLVPDLSISQISVFTGLTRETVAKRLDKAGARPNGKRRNHYVYDMKTVWRVLALGSENADSLNPEAMEPHSRLAYYRAEQARLSLAIEAGKYVQIEDYAAETARMFKLIAMGLDTVVDVLERDCGMTPQQLQVVEDHIDRIRNMIADSIQSGEAQTLEPEGAETE